MNGKALYQLDSSELRMIYFQIDQAEGEITEAIEEALNRALVTFEDKAEAMCKLITNLEANGKRFDGEAKPYDDEAKRLKSQGKRAWSKAEAMRALLMRELLKLGERKYTVGTFNITVADNSASSVAWEGDPYAIPEHLRKPPELDKSAVAEYLQHLTEAYGETAAIAKLTELGLTFQRGTHLRIS